MGETEELLLEKLKKRKNDFEEKGLRMNLGKTEALITSPDATQLNKTVLLSRVGRCDHFKDSTQQNSLVELTWIASGHVIEAWNFFFAKQVR
jgi:hypothetical protein